MRKKAWVIKAGLICSVLIFFIFIFHLGSETKTKDNSLSFQHNSQNNPVTCSYPDKSFCATMNDFTRYVTDSDFSDVLEAQQPTIVKCDGNVATKSYCRDIKNGLDIQLFPVNQNGHPILLTRNDYISFFRDLSQNNGPFKFSGTSNESDGINLIFANQATTSQLKLLFVKSGSQWKLQVPIISNS